MSRKIHLECCCCGGFAGHWEQWWNRDDGYGICRSCVDWQISRGTSAEEIRDLYGEEGRHYAPPAQAEDRA